MRLRPDVIAVISIVLLAIAASATGITNGFAFDDVYIIEKNKAIQSLARWWELAVGSYWPPERGGDLYRPLTMLSLDRKSTRLNSSHLVISYAVFCFASLLHPHSFPTRRSSDLSCCSPSPHRRRASRTALRSMTSTSSKRTRPFSRWRGGGSWQSGAIGPPSAAETCTVRLRC